MVSWELPSAIADADLVHFHQIYARSCEMGLLLAKQQRKPICVTDHGGHSSNLGMNLGFLELADRIIAYSDFGAALLRSKTRTPITLVKGGVDGARFFPPEPGRRPPRDRVLYVGRLLPHKGLDTLIEALPPALRLTLCGRAYHEPFYRRLQELAVGKQVEFITDADDATLLDLYRRAYANVLPSVYRDCYGTSYAAPELMGFTLLEAMACGTPAICSRVGGMPEYVNDGETGYVFDTPAELTAAITLLAGDPLLADRMGERARQVVDEEFDLKVAGRHQLYGRRARARDGGAGGGDGVPGSWWWWRRARARGDRRRRAAVAAWAAAAMKKNGGGGVAVEGEWHRRHSPRPCFHQTSARNRIGNAMLAVNRGTFA